jgi:hypothetical protein
MSSQFIFGLAYFCKIRQKLIFVYVKSKPYYRRKTEVGNFWVGRLLPFRTKRMVVLLLLSTTWGNTAPRL